jgi:DNA repair protein RadD
MFKLRTYQQEAADAAVDHLRGYGQPFIIQAATGAGKSLIIAEICHQINEPILILQPSKEILEQNYQKLLSYDPLINADIYSASKGRKEIARFTFATIGSIWKKPELFKHFKFVIIDECHGVDPKNLNGMLTSFLKAIDCRNVCGLTATPYRIAPKYQYEGGYLKAVASLKMINRISKTPFFKKIVYKIETAQLIDEGFLSPISYFKDEVDWDELQVNTTGADFTEASLEKFWNTKRLRRIAQAIEYSHHNNTRSLVFCSSIKQANNAMELIKAIGIDCEMVTGKTPMKERERIIADYKAGKIRHLLNVGVFTTGFDVPELDCIIMARPTMSLALYYQMIGRGVRLDPARPEKVLQVYDLVGIVERLGRVETIQVRQERSTKPFKRDEVWSEHGRMDDKPLYSFKIKPKEKKREKA